MTSTLDLTKSELHLSFDSTELSLVQLARDANFSANEFLNQQSSLVSVTRTPDEWTLVGPHNWFESHKENFSSSQSKITAQLTKEEVKLALQIAGPLDMSMTGVLAAICEPLKRAQVPVYALSTWDTDYVLIGKKDVEKAKQALANAGWQFKR
ncbi:hypothetical protein OIO90_005677 [Microbotryomycetes sp. JL221]|nr:hypothetical protein OIO90_005677 [Microbotryomycetes sp. JL221]